MMMFFSASKVASRGGRRRREVDLITGRREREHAALDPRRAPVRLRAAHAVVVDDVAPGSLVDRVDEGGEGLRREHRVGVDVGVLGTVLVVDLEQRRHGHYRRGQFALELQLLGQRERQLPACGVTGQHDLRLHDLGGDGAEAGLMAGKGGLVDQAYLS